MAFVMSQSQHLTAGQSVDDTMEISSDAGQYGGNDDIDIDIDIDGQIPQRTEDDPMDEAHTVDIADETMEDEGDGLEEEGDMVDVYEDPDDELLDVVQDDPEDLLDAEDTTHAEEPASTSHENGTGDTAGDDLDLDSGLLSTSLSGVPSEAVVTEATLNQPGESISDMSKQDLQENTALASEERQLVETEVTHETDTATLDASESQDHHEPVGSDVPHVIAVWAHSEFSMFSDGRHDEFFFEDASHAQDSLLDMFGHCRLVLQDELGDHSDLVFHFPQLHIKLHEASSHGSACSMKDLVDVYASLCANEDDDNPPALRLYISPELNLETQIEKLREDAANGRGLPEEAFEYAETVDTERDEQEHADGELSYAAETDNSIPAPADDKSAEVVSTLNEVPETDAHDDSTTAKLPIDEPSTASHQPEHHSTTANEQDDNGRDQHLSESGQPETAGWQPEEGKHTEDATAEVHAEDTGAGEEKEAVGSEKSAGDTSQHELAQDAAEDVDDTTLELLDQSKNRPDDEEEENVATHDNDEEEAQEEIDALSEADPTAYQPEEVFDEQVNGQDGEADDLASPGLSAIEEADLDNDQLDHEAFEDDNDDFHQDEEQHVDTGAVDGALHETFEETTGTTNEDSNGLTAKDDWLVDIADESGDDLEPAEPDVLENDHTDAHASHDQQPDAKPETNGEAASPSLSKSLKRSLSADGAADTETAENKRARPS